MMFKLLLVAQLFYTASSFAQSHTQAMVLSGEVEMKSLVRMNLWYEGVNETKNSSTKTDKKLNQLRYLIDKYQL